MLRWVAVAVVLTAVAFWVVRVVSVSDEVKIEDAIEDAAISDDPVVCTRDVTQGYLEQVTGLPGDAAVGTCLQTIDDPAYQVDGVEVSEVTVDGDDATALVEYDGSLLSGATVEIALVQVDGDWRLDRRLSFEGLDREALADGLRETLAEPPTSLTEEGAECAADRLLVLSKAGLESALISADTSAYSKAIVVCDRDAYLDAVAADYLEQGYPVELAACVREQLDRGSDDALVALLDDPVASTKISLRCDRGAFLDAYGELVVADGASEEAGDCVVSKLDELSDGEIARTAAEAGELDRIYAECGVAG